MPSPATPTRPGRITTVASPPEAGSPSSGAAASIVASREGSRRSEASAPDRGDASSARDWSTPGRASENEAATILPGSSKNREGTVETGGSSWPEDTDADDVEVDEELEQALAQVRNVSSAKATVYKRLLEQSQNSFSAQAHALQTEVQQIKIQLEARRRTQDVDSRAGRVPLTPLGQAAQWSVDVDDLRPSGGKLDHPKIKAFVHRLEVSERFELMRLILESCLPGDIGRMIDRLEHYRKTAFDLVAQLPSKLGVEILSYLTVPDVLGKACVSREWNALVQRPDLWRHHAIRLTETDPVRPVDPADPSQWLEIYKGLHFRERNWSSGIAQEVTFLRGHTNFVTSLALHGSTLLTGSYDETIRVWDLVTGSCKLVLQAKAISCLQFCPEEEVFAIGFHDVGRTQVWSSVTWKPLQTLSGHLHGIRAVALDGTYLVSAGADKALVVWAWRTGAKVIKFGQQTSVNVGLELIGDDKIVSVTLDGIIRCFSMSRREMIAQYKLNELSPLDPDLSQRLQSVGGGHLGSGQLAWMAAKGAHLTCATKNLIIHLEWETGERYRCDPPASVFAASEASLLKKGTTTPKSHSTSDLASMRGQSSLSPVVARNYGRGRASSTVGSRSPATSSATSKPLAASTASSLGSATTAAARPASSLNRPTGGRSRWVPILTRPPRIISVVDTPEASIGTVDPRKKRVVTSTRFSSRSGAERKMHVSTYVPRPLPATSIDSSPGAQASEPSAATKGRVAEAPLSGNETIATALYPSALGGAWASLPELATSDKGPMSLEIDHEKIVVGCSDGTIYVVKMAGHRFPGPPSAIVPA